MTVPAYPLQWPEGWKRTHPSQRNHAQFGRKAASHNGNWQTKRELTINEAVTRLREELGRMGISDDDLVINTNLKLRLDGLPKSDQRQPDDPGAVAYWRDRAGNSRSMAIDRYHRVADNLAAIAATIEAMRAIERHGGAEILNRAFTGFTAIEDQSAAWHVVLGVQSHAPTNDVRDAYKRARARVHPDRGGTSAGFDAVQRAYAAFCRERSIPE